MLATYGPSHSSHAECHTGIDMKRWMSLAFLVFSSVTFAAEYGPRVGAPVPPFEAQDQNGRQRSLKDILGPNGAALIFFRSADW